MVEKQNFYMDADIVYLKTDGVYKDIAEDIEIGFDTWTYQLDSPLPKGINKKANWINEMWIMRKKCVELRTKTHSYSTHDGSEDKKA